MKRLLFICAAILMAATWASQGIADPSHNLRFESQMSNTANAGMPLVVDQPVQTKPTLSQPTTPEEDPTTSPEILPPKIRTIVIDPGHGGTNEGAIGVAKIHEKHLTLQIAMLLADQLRKNMPDVQIVLTRQHDKNLSLTKRIDIANQLDADLFLSIHFNSSLNPEAIGFESFWVGDYWASDMVKSGIEVTDEIRNQREHTALLSERMAQCFNRAMRHRFDVLDRGVKPGDYTVLTQAKIPAVVLELGFLSHAQEGLDIIQPQTRAKLVDALAHAVQMYANGKSFNNTQNHP